MNVPASPKGFDIEAHRTEKMRRLECENEHLRSMRAQLERLLAQALRLATTGSRVTPTVLLALLEEIAATANELRDTA